MQSAVKKSFEKLTEFGLCEASKYIDLEDNYDFSSKYPDKDADALHEKYIYYHTSTRSDVHLDNHLLFGFQGSFNPLFEDIWLPAALEGKFNGGSIQGNSVSTFILRMTACRSFSWAVPSPTVLKRILQELVVYREDGTKASRRLIEVGAGTGYWAVLLKQLGADVIAVDNLSYGGTKCIYFSDMIIADGSKFVKDNQGFENDVLFMCWPRTDAGLDEFKGDTVIFIGEPLGGCTYSVESWLRRFPNQWTIVKVYIPQWPAMNDVMLICRRK